MWVGPSVESIIEQEVEMLGTGRLKHKNIVTVFGYHRGPYYVDIIMELCDSTLTKHINSGQHADKKLLLQLVEGVCYLHNQAKIVHRDLKPDNLLIRKVDMQLKICDFGTSEKLQIDGTFVNDRCCTEYWSAPELQSVPTQCKANIDVYSIGLIYQYIEPALNLSQSTSVLLKHLIVLMTERDSSQRIDVCDVVAHEYFNYKSK